MGTDTASEPRRLRKWIQARPCRWIWRLVSLQNLRGFRSIWWTRAESTAGRFKKFRSAVKTVTNMTQKFAAIAFFLLAACTQWLTAQEPRTQARSALRVQAQD